MRGLGSPQPGQQPDNQSQPVRDISQEGQNVTPEEQAEYEQVVLNAERIIYPEGDDTPPVSDKIVAGLTGTDKPVLNLATTAVTLIRGLDQSARAAGKPISEDVMFHAGADIMGDIADAAKAMKIYDYDEEEVEQAFYLGLDMYRTAAAEEGTLDVEGLKEGWQQLVEADRSGNLESVMPGIGDRIKDAT